MFHEIFRRKVKYQDHSLTLIYEMFYPHVYKIAYFITRDHYTTQDIVQETFIKIFINIDKLEDISKVKPWISTIATRTAIDFIRKQKRGNEFILDDFDTLKSSEKELAPAVEDEVELALSTEIIRTEIGKLSPEYRSVLHLKYIEDLKDQEIANFLDLNVATVKTRIHRAKNQLKIKLFANERNFEGANSDDIALKRGGDTQ